MTPKEIFLELLKKDGRPERLLDQYEALQMALGDPVNRYLREGQVRGTRTKDRWGVTILFPEDAPGTIPYHSDTCGSRPTYGSPQLFAVCCVLLRLLVPRHSPCALCSLTMFFHLVLLAYCSIILHL